MTTALVTAFDRVVSAVESLGLQVLHRGDEVMAQCPAHEDRTPSLSISRGDEKALVTCHAGCDIDRILGELKLTRADLYDEKRERQDRPQIVAEYDYTDADGAVLFQKIRYVPKDFRVRRPDGHGGWEWKLGKETPRVLYRLPEVRAAIAAGRPILVVEGEKDADRATRDLNGMVATCNFEGATKDGRKWRREYVEQLRGAKVLVIADNDDVGQAHARAVRAREVCQDAERRFGLTSTAPADRSMASRPPSGRSPSRSTGRTPT